MENSTNEIDLRKFCLELAAKRNEDRTVIAEAAMFEHYIKNGFDDIYSCVQFEKRILKEWFRTAQS